MDERSSNNIKDYRTPRGPSYMGEKGFSHRSSQVDKPSSADNRKYNNNNNNNMGSPPQSTHGKRTDRYNMNDMKGRRDRMFLFSFYIFILFF